MKAGKHKNFESCTTITERVYFLLEKNVEYRENDSKLISAYYYHSIPREELKEMYGFDVLNMIANSELSSFESVSRIRRALQKKHPHLRGDNHDKKRERCTYVFKISDKLR